MHQNLCKFKTILISKKRYPAFIYYTCAKIQVSMPGFYSKMTKNSGKGIPPVCSTWQEESNGISFFPFSAIFQEEFGDKA